MQKSLASRHFNIFDFHGARLSSKVVLNSSFSSLIPLQSRYLIIFIGMFFQYFTTEKYSSLTEHQREPVELVQASTQRLLENLLTEVFQALKKLFLREVNWEKGLNYTSPELKISVNRSDG